MEWHADTEEDDAPKNPLFEYCSMKQEEYWAKSPPESGKSHLDKVRSAIAGMLTRKGKMYSTAAVKSMQDFYRGVYNVDAKKKQKTSADHSKEMFPLFLYAEICKAFLRRGQIWAWAFLVLQWNFMSRSINVGQIHFNFMDWSGDMLTVLYSHTETLDKDSRQGLKPFHLAANPDEPWICPITAIAVMLFSDVYHAGQALFSGSSVANNFGKTLAEVLNDPAVVKALHEAGLTATHSVRKSAASYASGGSAATVTIFSLLLRGGRLLTTFSNAISRSLSIKTVFSPDYCRVLTRRKNPSRALAPTLRQRSSWMVACWPRGMPTSPMADPSCILAENKTTTIPKRVFIFIR